MNDDYVIFLEFLVSEAKWLAIINDEINFVLIKIILADVLKLFFLQFSFKISDKFGLKRQSSANSIRPPGRPPLLDYFDENSVQQNQVRLITL